MTKKIKIRAKESNGVVTVKSLMSHPMETGLRKNSKTGKKIAAHFIQEVIGKVGDQTVIEAYWGGAVSKNPYLSFKYKGQKGDQLSISWIDNQGQSETLTVLVQ